MTYEFPRNGKIVLLAPETAVRLFDQAPQHADRIFVRDGIEVDKAFVIDLDVMGAMSEIPERDAWDFLEGVDRP